MAIQVVLGLGFGDEGKGTIVDWLARRAKSPPLVVRFNGGPQAQHHVVTDDGRVHCFAQLGSASFVDGARTHLAHDMAVDPFALHAEIAQFGRPVDVTIDPRCVVVTPWHAIVNRIRESLRGAGRHGTTGRGIREAKLGDHRLLVGDLTLDGLRAHRDKVMAEAEALAPDHELIERGRDDELFATFADAALKPADAALRSADAGFERVAITTEVPRAASIIFESAQGALLDRDHGFWPHVTPSRITRKEAEVAARQLRLSDDMEVWGVLRAYYTRHGEGPFPTEDPSLHLPELHNREDGPAGRFRVGGFDAELARKAIGFAGPIDKLAITCLDRMTPLRPNIVEEIESALGRRIDVQSWGPAARDKRTLYSADA
jgi:adenylosuccinate synthase